MEVKYVGIGLCRENGKENGNYYVALRVYGSEFRVLGFSLRG